MSKWVGDEEADPFACIHLPATNPSLTILAAIMNSNHGQVVGQDEEDPAKRPRRVAKWSDAPPLDEAARPSAREPGARTRAGPRRENESALNHQYISAVKLSGSIRKWLIDADSLSS